MADYLAFLEDNADSIDAFTHSRQRAFRDELNYWKDAGLLEFEANPASVDSDQMVDIPDGCVPVYSQVSGCVWQMCIQPSDCVDSGQTLMVLESMKMEIAINTPIAGELQTLLVAEGQQINAGQLVAVVRAAD